MKLRISAKFNKHPINTRLIIDTDKDVEIARVYGDEILESRIEYARLFAAAPDLLEACQYVVDWHRKNDSGEGELFGLDFVTTCIAAIRKATT